MTTDRELLAAALETVTGPYRRLTDMLLDALLPIVDRIATVRAAAELRAAAHAITEDGRPDLTTVDQVQAVNDAAQWLDARADALDPP